MSAETKPPALPGVMWWGTDGDGDQVAVTATPDRDGIVFHRVWLRNDDTDDWREYQDAEMTAHVFYVMALAERARAEKAEAVAEAWAKWAEHAGHLANFCPPVSNLHPHDIDDVQAAQTGMIDATVALRALGVEP